MQDAAPTAHLSAPAVPRTSLSKRCCSLEPPAQCSSGLAMLENMLSIKTCESAPLLHEHRRIGTVLMTLFRDGRCFMRARRRTARGAWWPPGVGCWASRPSGPTSRKRSSGRTRCDPQCSDRNCIGAGFDMCTTAATCTLCPAVDVCYARTRCVEGFLVQNACTGSWWLYQQTVVLLGPGCGSGAVGRRLLPAGHWLACSGASQAVGSGVIGLLWQRNRAYLQMLLIWALLRQI